MFQTEGIILLIVACYILFRAIGHERPGNFFIDLALLGAASWMAEESCISIYGFYGYSSSWRLFIGHVPVLILLIWPIVVYSARDLTAQLVKGSQDLIPPVAGGVVLTDALLIEPVASNAGLWTWNQPGIFGVPPVGILGWGYFAFLCVLIMQRDHGGLYLLKRGLMLLVVPVLATHLLLLVTWWGALRWIRVPITPELAVLAAWSLSLFLVYWMFRFGKAGSVNRKILWLRLPAALFIFALFFDIPGPPTTLVVYAAAFVPPYLLLMVPRQWFSQREENASVRK